MTTGGARMLTVGRVAAWVAAATIPLTLAACTMDGVTPSPSSAPASSPPTATSEPAATETPGPGLEAIITIASVDVDGLNATVSGYVSGIIEDGGACTFELTGPTGTVVRAETTGIADRSTTSCGAASIPIDRLSSGTWSVELGYRSDAADVISEPTTLEVP
ncbi:hypothetical protein ACFPER_11720 [Agromyces aurantiacus]|uniref:Bacterial spore germination immunoglobulin-like domain-containing protein n=1 Tax=Agromyces aurantiacus TaxID=165814 RepID=A0ABV9R6V9_9MICO|nr:hypothetical protein [Agromyces aurantiacus]MBM7504148.1 hypothetical protein [Agromyces aurantiacus]